MTFVAHQTMNMCAGVPASARETSCVPYGKVPERLKTSRPPQGHARKAGVRKRILAAGDAVGKSESFSVRRTRRFASYPLWNRNKNPPGSRGDSYYKKRLATYT